VIVLLLALLLSASGHAGKGSIAGRVSYIGRVPEPVYVFESGQEQPVITLDAKKGVAGAVVSVDAPSVGSDQSAPELTVIQRNWWFTPGVVAVRSGQPVRFTNEDPSNHSVRSTTGNPANRFGAYTGTGQPYVHRFRANTDGAPSVITCDIHAWMMAWVYVFDHPHFAQTDRAGNFSIPNLAPGKYRLFVRHGPSGLSRDVNVAIAADRETRVEVTFDTPDLKPSNR
jgi:plastocyanin